jgi:hypothetical protein
MDATVGKFEETGDILIIPVFKGVEKAPNNTTTGLSRGASIAVKAAAASEALTGKRGELLHVWTKGCMVVFYGVGKSSTLTHKAARDAGAKCLTKLSKNHGTDVVVRFTSGWKLDAMAEIGRAHV